MLGSDRDLYFAENDYGNVFLNYFLYPDIQKILWCGPYLVVARAQTERDGLGAQTLITECNEAKALSVPLSSRSAMGGTDNKRRRRPHIYFGRSVPVLKQV